MAYTKKTWEDYPDTSTPINADDLNNIEDGIEALDTSLSGGWISASETWTYASTDDPTGVITISGNVTTKYSKGMRIKFTNNGNTIYGIITKVTDTQITFLHEIDPTDSLALHLMTDSSITNNYYSSMKAPHGFPLNGNKWSVSTIISTTDRAQSYPVNGTWYNVGEIQLRVPIGSWKVSVGSTYLAMRSEVDVTDNWVKSTLSTSNNSESDIEFTKALYQRVPATNLVTVFGATHVEKELILTTPTTYYLNLSTLRDNNNTIRVNASVSPTIIKAVCAYL